MRTEKEILDAVIGAAMADDGVRAVVRTNLMSERAFSYEYDFCFVVHDPEKYESDEVFASCFGERILLFRSDRSYPGIFPDTKAHLMVFRDGTTIVIYAMRKDAFLRMYGGSPHENVWIGSTFQKLLDKDGMLPVEDRPEETQTLFARVPSQAEFSGACAEFWWVMKTFAGYALREELPPAMFYLQGPVRDLLNRMLHWHIYLRSGRPVDLGVLDGNLESLLEKDLFLLYRKTYPDADYAHIREAYDAVVELWRAACTSVARRCGFSYDRETEKAMSALLRDLWETKEAAPRDTAQIENETVF